MYREHRNRLQTRSLIADQNCLLTEQTLKVEIEENAKNDGKGKLYRVDGDKRVCANCIELTGIRESVHTVSSSRV